MFKILCFTSVLFVLLSYIECQHSIHGSDSVQTSASSSWPYPTQQTTQSGGEYSSGHIHQRQGTSLGNLPMFSFLPILIMIGVGALIIIPILFLLFNMSPMGGLGVGFPGATPFGRKRSVDSPLMDQNMLLEMIASIGSVIEQHFNKFENKKI